MNNNVVLLSFADCRYIDSLKNLEEMSQSFPFTKRIFMTELDLPENFRNELHYKIHRRGFGYWKWKPFIVLETLKTLDEGDILFYMDAGCSLNKGGLDRFKEYIKIVSESKNGILAFQHPHLEKDWTKGDLLNYLNCYENNDILMSLQLASGLFMLRKCKSSMDIAQKWLDVYEKHYDLCTDKISCKKNLVGFIENRHDQSVLSLLFKQVPHDEISWTETQTLDDVYDERMAAYPILCCRTLQKNQRMYLKIKQKMSYPYRWIIMFFLKHFGKMHFAGKRVF